MALSWVSTSISMFLKSQKAFLLALEPLRQNNNNYCNNNSKNNNNNNNKNNNNDDRNFM